MTGNVLNYFDQADSVGNNPLNLNGSVYSAGMVQTLISTVSLAQSNAGVTILPGVAGKTITIVDFAAKVSGNYATNTAILLQDTNGTPVVVATAAVAALTTGNILNEKTTNVTMGAGYLAPLTAGAGVAVANSGTAATGGTSITFKINYVIS